MTLLQRQIGDLQTRLNERSVEVSELRNRLMSTASHSSPDHSSELMRLAEMPGSYTIQYDALKEVICAHTYRDPSREC